jgi:hypothetical protein
MEDLNLLLNLLQESSNPSNDVEEFIVQCEVRATPETDRSRQVINPVIYYSYLVWKSKKLNDTQDLVCRREFFKIFSRYFKPGIRTNNAKYFVESKCFDNSPEGKKVAREQAREEVKEERIAKARLRKNSRSI